jgi:predicted glycosyltransferase
MQPGRWRGGEEAETKELGRGRKILLYSHDTFGLGNIRRTLLIASALAEGHPGAAVLIVTGSPVVHSFRIPGGIDYIKLPSLDRVDAERYEPRFLHDWSEEVMRTRRAILSKAVLGFAPDLLIVDKRPTGVSGELLDTLDELRATDRRTRLVLGVRDILDAPERTRRHLAQSGFFESIERFYDEVWVYGSRNVFDPREEYGYPPSVTARTRLCGYLCPPVKRLESRGGSPRIVVTCGGGSDGGVLLGAYLEGLASLPRSVRLRSSVMFGPLMAEATRDALIHRYQYLPDVEFHDFHPDPLPLYARADVVVSMAGFNSVCELLALRRRAVLVPRDKPVMEQLTRARRLAELGCVDMVEPEALTPGILIDRVMAALDRPEPDCSALDLDGLPRVLERVRVLLGGAAS